MKVEVLHLGNVVLVSHPVIVRCGKSLRQRRICLYCKKSLSFSRREHVGVSYETFLDGFSLSDEEIKSAARRKFAAELSYLFSDAHRNFVIDRSARLAVDVVSAEYLVSAFTGKHHLELFRSYIAHKIECNCRRIRKRFVHMVLDLRKNVPVLLRCDDLAGVFLSDSLRKVLCPAYFVISFVGTESDCKCLVNVCYCSNVA